MEFGRGDSPDKRRQRSVQLRVADRVCQKRIGASPVCKAMLRWRDGRQLHSETREIVQGGRHRGQAGMSRLKTTQAARYRDYKRRCPETDVEILNAEGENVGLALHGKSSNKCSKHIMAKRCDEQHVLLAGCVQI